LEAKDLISSGFHLPHVPFVSGTDPTSTVALPLNS
jgi:hypothetical protein